jgi:putative aldouronate transport system substrate-binding protein
MKKLLVIALALVLLLAGCSTTPTTTTAGTTTGGTTTKQTTTAEPKFSLPADGTVEIVIGTFDNWYSPASYNDNLAIFQEIQKDTGLKIVWDVVPPAQYADAMRIRIAAGAQGLPDMINVPGGANAVQLGMDGILEPLNDLIATYAPYTSVLFAEDDVLMRLATAPDGNIYALSSDVRGSAYANPFVVIARGDWFEKLDVKVPTTVDEWTTALRAFKAKDANGNGLDDEIPITASGWYNFARTAEFWGLRSTYGSFYDVKDGKIVDQKFTPQYKEWLEWCALLYSEGLLDSEIFNMNSDLLVTKINRNIVGAHVNFISNIPSYNNNLAASGITAKYIPVAPVKGPYGHTTMDAYGPISGDFGITTDSKVKEYTMLLMDYIYASPEGIRYCMFGVEGISYNMVDGKPVLTDFVLKNPDGKGSFEALRSLGSWPNVPYRQMADAYNAILLAPNPDFVPFVEKVTPLTTFVDFPPMIRSTQEETDTVARYSADLNTYLNEMIAKFVTGEESFTNFDAFLTQLKALGADEILKVNQAKYDRFSAD